MGKMIKFEYVNEHGDFEKVLSHFGIDYEKKGTQLRALCPFHEDTNPSLSVALEADGDTKPNTWHCFGCRQSGSIIDFAALMTGETLRDGAELVAEISGCAVAPARTGKANAKKPVKGAETPAKARKSSKRANPGPVAENRNTGGSDGSEDTSNPEPPNPPLPFSLTLDQEHVAVSERVLPGVALTFGVGVCDPKSRSMMAGRLCVPIHNVAGELIAYAGRYLGEDSKEPKWLLPPGFEKQHVLFNAHRVVGARTVVLVEGFFDAIRLHALGFPAVACMGTAVSGEQIALLQRLGAKRIAVMFDGDPGGKTAALSLAVELTREFFLRIIDVPEGEDPASLDEKELRALLEPLRS
jgi:DNA primase